MSLFFIPFGRKMSKKLISQMNSLTQGSLYPRLMKHSKVPRLVAKKKKKKRSYNINHNSPCVLPAQESLPQPTVGQCSQPMEALLHRLWLTRHISQRTAHTALTQGACSLHPKATVVPPWSCVLFAFQLFQRHQ